MRLNRVHSIALAGAACLSSSLTLTAAAAGADPSGASCQGGLKVATGAAGKGYAKLFANAAEVCGEQIRLCEVRTGGGLDNLDVLANKRADIGFAQVDTVQDMAKSNEAIRALQVVLPLNANYLHVLTNASGYTYQGPRRLGILPGATRVEYVRKVSDLKGKSVALVGSAKLLGRVMAQRYLPDYHLTFIDASDDQSAFEMARSGTVQAVFTVGGAPHGEVDKLLPKDRLSLVPFDVPVPAGQYAIKKLNYKNLSTYNLPALAVQNVLLTRPFGEAKAAQVALLRQCLVDHLTKLKDGDYEPAWNEMRLDTPVDLPAFAPPPPTRGPSGR